MNTIKFEEYKGYKIEVIPDECPESPREWDNLGIISAFHKRYDLGDKTDIRSSGFNSWAELEKILIREKEATCLLPLYLLDHSGLRISVGSASFRACDPVGWDWGKIGYIYTKRDKIKEAYGVKKITKKIMQKVEEVLRSEIEIYDQYLQGDVYGYRITKEITVKKIYYPDGRTIEVTEDEEIDSCWGFYGIDTAIDEAKSLIDHLTMDKSVA